MNDKVLKKFIRKALTKQFSIVGQKYNQEFVKSPEWYSQYSWTSQEREKFHKWFILTIRKDLKLTKKAAEQELQYWNLMWGWRDEI